MRLPISLISHRFGDSLLHVFVLLTPRYFSLILGVFPLHQIAPVWVNVSMGALSYWAVKLFFEVFQLV